MCRDSLNLLEYQTTVYVQYRIEYGIYILSPAFNFILILFLCRAERISGNYFNPRGLIQAEFLHPKEYKRENCQRVSHAFNLFHPYIYIPWFPHPQFGLLYEVFANKTLELDRDF